MAKRFIDTAIFDDEWFLSLSVNGKLFWIYYITKCDHAGLLRLNKKLIEFQTGLDSLETVIKELGNSLQRVNEQLLFCPKYIKFQYPNFPNSAVMQQFGAINLLKKYGLWDEELNSYRTVAKELGKSNVYNSINTIKNIINIDSDEKKIDEHKLQKYVREKLPQVSKLKTQLSFDNCEDLIKEYPKALIFHILNEMENKADLLKKYKSVYLTCISWMKRKTKEEIEGFRSKSIEKEEKINYTTNASEHFHTKIAESNYGTDLRAI